MIQPNYTETLADVLHVSNLEMISKTKISVKQS